LAQTRKDNGFKRREAAAAENAVTQLIKDETYSEVEMKLADGASMMISIGNCQDKGVRSYQEDSFGYSNIADGSVLSKRGMMAVLSDGMGGLSDGKTVSSYAVQAAISMFERINPKVNIRLQLESIVAQINKNVCTQYLSNGVSKAGATIVIAYIYKNRIYWACVGDSRLYCFRNGNLLQMNEDHDYKNQLLRDYIDKNATLESANSDAQKDRLVSFIGKEGLEGTDSSVIGYRIKPGDMFVLCSDGIYNAISEDSLTELLTANDAQAASEKIVERVKSAHFPGQDNMTVMVIGCKKKQQK